MTWQGRHRRFRDRRKSDPGSNLTVAFYTVITDSKDEQAKAFYSQYGFLLLSSADAERRLFLPMYTIEMLFAEER